MAIPGTTVLEDPKSMEGPPWRRNPISDGVNVVCRIATISFVLCPLSHAHPAPSGPQSRWDC